MIPLIASAAARAYGVVARVLPLQREPFRSLYNAAYFRYKRLEDPFASLLRTRPDLIEHGHVIDIGANIGYTTLLFASLVQPPYAVHAVEPDDANITLLRRNTERSRRRDRIRIYEAAAGVTSGRAFLAVNPVNPTDHRMMTPASRTHHKNVEVDVIAVDDIAGVEPIAFVKMDVQGFELEVSRGMVRTLDRNPRIAVAIEYAPAAMADLGFVPTDLLSFYAERGFSFYPLGRPALASVSPEKIATEVTGPAYVNLLCLRR